MSRRPQPPIVYANRIGQAAADLHAHGDIAARQSLLMIACVNLEVMRWLQSALADVVQKVDRVTKSEATS